MTDERRRPFLTGGEHLIGEGERPPGRTSTFHPRELTDAWRHLLPQAETMVDGLNSLPKELAGKHVVFEAQLLPNYLSASNFPAGALGRDLYVVGSKSSVAPYQTAKTRKDAAPTKTLLIAGDLDCVRAFAVQATKKPVSDRGDWRDLRKFETLRLPDPEKVVRGLDESEEMPRGQRITWEAVLTRIGRDPFEQEAWNNEAFEKFVVLARDAGGAVHEEYRRNVAGVTFVPVLLAVEDLARVVRHNLLRALRPMAKLRPMPSDGLRALSVSPVLVPPKAPPISSRAIAVFDGGVPATCAALSANTRVVHLTSQPPTDEMLGHGCLVTSAVMFGPLLGSGLLPAPRAPVDHFRVFPLPPGERFDDNLVWFLDQVCKHAPRYEIVNLSAGPDATVAENDDAPHVWTATLDQLTAEHGTTFVVAAGNNGEEDAVRGYNRVLTPADMVNGLGVGACDEMESRVVKAAPYSARGPGRDGQRTQPLGVQFGGVEARPFLGVGPAGALASHTGTSFSAPTVTGSLAVLAAQVGSELTSPSLLRAFSAHFAQRSSRGHSLLDVGHGRIAYTYDRYLDCAPNECHVLYRETIPRGQAVSFAIPVPEFSDPAIKVDVRWTFAFTSEVDASSTAEYTLDGLEYWYRPNLMMRTVTDVATEELLGAYDVRLQQDEIRELERARVIQIGNTPLADGRNSTKGVETAQRRAGKWETVVQRKVPKTSVGRLYQPRLDFNYLRRGGGQLEGREDGLAMCMIVSVAAPKGVDLYDRVRLSFPVLTPIEIHLGV